MCSTCTMNSRKIHLFEVKYFHPELFERTPLVHRCVARYSYSFIKIKNNYTNTYASDSILPLSTLFEARVRYERTNRARLSSRGLVDEYCTQLVNRYSRRYRGRQVRFVLFLRHTTLQARIGKHDLFDQ